MKQIRNHSDLSVHSNGLKHSLWFDNVNGQHHPEIHQHSICKILFLTHFQMNYIEIHLRKIGFSRDMLAHQDFQPGQLAVKPMVAHACKIVYWNEINTITNSAQKFECNMKMVSIEFAYNCHFAPGISSGAKSRRMSWTASFSTIGGRLSVFPKPPSAVGRYGGAATRKSKNCSITCNSSGLHWTEVGFPSLGNGDTLICNDCMCVGFKNTWHCNESTLNSTTPGSVDTMYVSYKWMEAEWNESKMICAMETRLFSLITYRFFRLNESLQISSHWNTAKETLERA